jgi:hypothetical protein
LDEGSVPLVCDKDGLTIMDAIAPAVGKHEARLQRGYP